MKYILVLVLRLISRMPLPILYVFSSLAFLLLYYIVGYRKKVVRRNLSRSFPAQDKKWLRQQEKIYYRYLADLLAENVKSLTASEAFIRKHCFFHDLSLFERLYREQKTFIVVMGHLGNWEWSGLSMSISGKHQLKALYRPIKDPFFDAFFRKFRTRFGGEMIPMAKVARDMAQGNAVPACYTFIADQTAPKDASVWLDFLHQDTPFFDGYEKLARRYQLPVVFVSITREKRGYYRIYTELVAENISALPEGEVVRRFAGSLEKNIREQPAFWLWSHKRWKHTRG